MEAVFSVEMLDVAAKAEEFGLDKSELEGLLTAAGIPIFPAGDRKGVTAASWMGFVADAIRRTRETGGTGLNGKPAPSTVGPSGAAEAWGEERRKQLQAYPETAKLLDDFKSYLKRNEPKAVLQQNRWTITIIMPGNRWAGLKPRGYGLLLYATREGRKLEERLESPEDFERGLEWLRGLPRYK